ncbi:MAG: hypothetical protein V1750_09805, partial [Acidobacteriota bacterium]
LAGPERRRELPLASFFLGVKKTVLAPDEILAAIIVPPPPPGLRSGFDKIRRGWGHDLALVNAAAAFDPEAGTLRAAIGSCGVTPVLLPTLTGIEPGGADAFEVGERLAALAATHICPIDDVRATAEYRTDMAALLCRRLATRLLNGEGRP